MKASSSEVEVISFSRLRKLNDGDTQRADFYVVGVVTGGVGSVSIDFTEYRLNAGSVVWIPPGAVHRWTDMAVLAGHLILFVPTAPVTDHTRALVAPPGPLGVVEIDVESWPAVERDVDHLRRESNAVGVGVQAEIPLLLLSALLARLPRSGGPEGIDGALAAQFRAALEDGFARHHDAQYYAKLLGFAPRTLSRAVVRSTGRTAKGAITDRVILEAKRLLVHEKYSVAGCAQALGFADASTFTAYFRASTGEPPGVWRSRSPTL